MKGLERLKLDVVTMNAVKGGQGTIFCAVIHQKTDGAAMPVGADDYASIRALEAASK